MLRSRSFDCRVLLLDRNVHGWRSSGCLQVVASMRCKSMNRFWQRPFLRKRKVIERPCGRRDPASRGTHSRVSAGLLQVRFMQTCTCRRSARQYRHARSHPGDPLRLLKKAINPFLCCQASKDVHALPLSIVNYPFGAERISSH